MTYEQMLHFYTEMAYIRAVEQKIADEYKHQEMRCPVHLSIGQEAVPVAVSKCLKSSDHVVSAHRSHAHYLAKGADLNAMICELFGKSDGCAAGKGGSMHLIDMEVNVTAAVPIVGSSISIGTGVAFGLKKGGSGQKVAIYFGDGATEEGVFAESLDFASLHNLPALFVCENNLYSVYTSIEQRQASNRNLEKICQGHGIKSFHGDGNNIVEAFELARNAVSYMEDTGKAALLEFTTYRWLEHCGPNWDDHLGYRKTGELKNWMDRCPLTHCLGILCTFPEHDNGELLRIDEKISAKINDSFKHARKNPFPSSDELFADVYAEIQL
jgi:TPP-dependent pyruvate/acetoin dehydrogenase alpha subunit